MKTFVALILSLIGVQCFAAQPQLRTVQAIWDQYPLSDYPAGSNGVITIYKSTSLGAVWTPFKPTSIVPATRTNTFFQVVAPNTFRFYATVTIQPFGESAPSSPTITNAVTLTQLKSLSLGKQRNAKLKTLNPNAKKPIPVGPAVDAVGHHRSPK